jgi:hypothetical protein
MAKDAFASIGMVIVLLVLVVFVWYWQKQNQLVAVRPQRNEATSLFFNNFGQWLGGSETATTGADCDCPTLPTPTPTPNQKQQWQAAPVAYIRSQIELKFAPDMRQAALATSFYGHDQMWWRAEKENYRILIPDAQVVGFQVPTTDAAAKLVPAKPNDLHPAQRHPLLKKVTQEVNKLFSSLGYKKSSFQSCPVSEAYDPFDNCVATYTRDEHKCSLIAGYGRVDRVVSDDPYLRLELACSDSYQSAYDQAVPYLYAVNVINPEWRVPDMAVHEVVAEGELTRVNFGQTQAYFQKLDNGLRLVSSKLATPNCEVVTDAVKGERTYLNCR